MVDPQRSDDEAAAITEAEVRALFAPREDGSRPSLRGATLRGASLRNTNLEGLDLTGADLSGAHLVGANLAGAILDAVVLRASDLASADLRGAKLAEADLRGAMCEDANLAGATMRFADAREAFFENANLEGADLLNANLSGAELEGANLRGAVLEGANLGGADLRRANLEGAHLVNANLAGAKLGGARLAGVDLTSCNIAGIHVARAILERTLIEWDDLGGEIGEERDGDYPGAERGYHALERNFLDLGEQEAARSAYLKRRRMQKLGARAAFALARRAGDGRGALAALRTYVGDLTVEWLCDYGESVPRVLAALVAVYIGFAVLYGVTGSVVRIDAGVRSITRRPIDLAIFSLLALTTSGSPGVGLQPRDEYVYFISGIQALFGISFTGLLGFVIGNRIRRLNQPLRTPRGPLRSA